MSSNLKSDGYAVRVVIWRSVICAGPCISFLERSVIEGENPVFDTDYQCSVMHFLRVELFGNAAQNGW
jgi:hypothetical protein